MLKKITITAVSAAFALGAFAAPISPEEALSRMASSGVSRIVSAAESGLKLSYTSRLESGIASAYVFTKESGCGFVILSADDKAVPVLGYSDTESIVPSNLPPSFLWWLNKQAERIATLQSDDASSETPRPYAPQGYAPVSPLLKTKWNQDSPYNDQTPIVSGEQSPTGCVATSFAQVMNYFKYPECGEGTIRYTDSYGKRRTMSLVKDFMWDQMLDEYVAGSYTEQQAEAVSYLMKACGYSVEMNYGRYASGAQSYKLVNAAVTYFKYSPATYYAERERYSSDQWFDIIYNNLKNVGPVIYDGQSIEGGHSFVCDGYDGNGYFHFNWGWGGLSDGYYVLDSLNPESQGIGGAEGGFNFSQGALIGMCPPNGSPVEPRYANMLVYGNVTASLSGATINFKATDSAHPGWANGSFRDISVNVGAIVTRIGETASVVEVSGVMKSPGGQSSLSTISLGPGGYYPVANLNPTVTLPSLPDGEYKVTIAVKDVSMDDAPWQPIECYYGCVNYCLLTVSGGNMTVSNAAPAKIVFENCGFDSPLYIGRNAKLAPVIKNTSDLQLTLCYSPVLWRNGAIQYQGDYMLATVESGQTYDKPSLVAFSPLDNATDTGYGEYELRILDRATNQIIGTFGTYELTSVSSNTKVVLDDFSILDTSQENVTSGSRTFKDVYMVKNSADINAMFKISVTQGYLDTSVRIVGSRYNPETGKYENLDHDVYNTQPFLGEGQDMEVNVPIDFSSLQGGYVYDLSVAYFDGSRNRALGSILLTFDGTGIDSIGTDFIDGEAEYYSLQGIRVDNPQRGQILIRKAGGIISKIRF